MKKTILLIIIIFAFNSLSRAQDASSPSLLTVQGVSEMSVKPTQTIVSLTIKSEEKTYAGAVKSLIERVNILSTNFKEIEFEEKNIMTSNFQVNKNQININGKWIEEGFIAVQSLKVVFKQDKKRLLEVLNTATSSKANPEIAIAFDLDNISIINTRNELIKAAVKDAKSKAEIIAKEANYQISGIKEINYMNTFYYPRGRGGLVESNMYMDKTISNFEVESLTFSENVSIVFEITKK